MIRLSFENNSHSRGQVTVSDLSCGQNRLFLACALNMNKMVRIGRVTLSRRVNTIKHFVFDISKTAADIIMLALLGSGNGPSLRVKHREAKEIAGLFLRPMVVNILHRHREAAGLELRRDCEHFGFNFAYP